MADRETPAISQRYAILTRINGAKEADLELNDILDSMENEVRGKFVDCFGRGMRAF